MEKGKVFHVTKSQTNAKEPLLLEREPVESTVERNVQLYITYRFHRHRVKILSRQNLILPHLR